MRARNRASSARCYLAVTRCGALDLCGRSGHRRSLPRDLGLASTHAFSVPDALELGRELGRAPQRVIVVAVEGASFRMGDPLTPEVDAALDETTAMVLTELGRA